MEQHLSPLIPTKKTALFQAEKNFQNRRRKLLLSKQLGKFGGGKNHAMHPPPIPAYSGLA